MNVWESLSAMRQTLRGRPGLRFSDPARLPGAPAAGSGDGLGVARRDGGQPAVVAGPVRAGRLPDDLGEPGTERAEGGTADRHAHLGDAAVTAAQQRLGPLDPPGHQVVVRRLAVRRAELAGGV